MGNLLHKALFQNGLIPSYSKMADLASLRHKLIASNIANVNSPGYARKEINFDSELQRAINKPKIHHGTTHPGHIPLGNSPDRPPHIRSEADTENSTGVNSVDIDQEMANLAQNQIMFEYSADMLSRKFRALKNAIRGENR